MLDGGIYFRSLFRAVQLHLILVFAVANTEIAPLNHAKCGLL